MAGEREEGRSGDFSRWIKNGYKIHSAFSQELTGEFSLPVSSFVLILQKGSLIRVKIIIVIINKGEIDAPSVKELAGLTQKFVIS